MITIGIIGAGRMAKVHMRCIVAGVPQIRIKSVSDPYMSEETKAFLREIGVENILEDHKPILGDPEIKAVMICSSTDTHAQLSVEAIEAGKHIFCEKPLDQGFEKVLPILDALKNHPEVKFQVGFNRRFDHNFRALRNAIQSGEVGELHFVRVCSRDSVTPPQSYVHVSGGIFLDMMIHDIDIVRYLSGADVEEVYARGNVLIHQYFADEGDVDTAVVSMKLSNGAIAVIDNSRKAVYGYDQRAEVHGSKGAAEIRNDRESALVTSTSGGVCINKPIEDTLERYLPAYTAELVSFAKAVEEGAMTEVSANDGLQAILVGLACTKSLAENRPVALREIMG